MEGCSEHQLLVSRRGFLAGAVGLYTSTLFPGPVFASTTSANRRLMIVILRGGLDGLSVLVPYGDRDYEALRGDLTVSRERINGISDLFGLHPALSNIHNLYRSGQAAFIPSVGLPVRTRSHFQCQANLEDGMPSVGGSSSGWLNRLLVRSPRHGISAGGGPLTVGPVPRILSGQAPVLSWSPSWFAPPASQVQSALTRMYRNEHADLGRAYARGRAVQSATTRATSSIDRQQDPLLYGFLGAAKLLSANSGPRVAVLSVSGWDTHAAQGTLEGQTMNRLSLLDQCIGAFRREMSASAWSQTIVLCVSEFGRTVRVNGTQGTDHGVGMPVLMFGGAVAGGIHGDWPGLAEGSLIDGRDLRPTADIRSVFKGVLHEHMGLSSSLLHDVAFPSSRREAPIMSGLVRNGGTSRMSDTSASAVGVETRSAGASIVEEARDLLAYRSIFGA